MEQRLTTNCTIYTLINKQRLRPNGTARLYTRITIKGAGSKKIPLPLYWPADKFDYVHNEILPREKDDPDYLTYTALIKTEQAKYWRVVKKLLLKDAKFTLKDIIAGVKIGDKGKYAATWMLFKIVARQRGQDKDIKSGTARNHKCSANWVLKYRPEDVPILEIDSKWLNKYLVWLMKYMAYSGAWSRVKDLKAYVMLAKEAGFEIATDFENHYLADPEHEPVYLEKEEMDKLFELYKDPNLTMENRWCLRAFLFNCFTGMRISDLKRFNPTTWIQGDEIVFEPAKKRLTSTKEHIVKIPLIGIAKEFLSTLGDGILFERSEVKYNKRLKTIADLAGIDKNITSHVARHSFATQLAVLGVPVIVISKLLGHKNISSTMVYIHIADKIRKKEMDKLQSAFSSYTLEPSLPVSA